MKRIQGKYWFTCGWVWNTSEKCRCLVDGNKKEATVDNRMGVSCKIVQDKYIKWLSDNDLVVNNLKPSIIINTALSKLPSSTKYVIIIIKNNKDASQKYIRIQDAHILSNVVSYNSLDALLPNNKQIVSLH